jgi:hypothetical protein
MAVFRVEVSVNGNPAALPAVEIDDAVVISSGRFPRIAAIKDESFVDAGVPQDPARFVALVSASLLPADIVTFPQQIDDPVPRHPFYYELDNVAAADSSDFARWWEKLPQSTRKNCRRAERRGVVTQVVSLDEQLAQGIKNIYDETPTRQGRRFWHYGKDVQRVLLENSAYLDRSEFVASYSGSELIGFMKIVYVGRVARIMQLLSLVSHYDKRPMNALIAKAVEVCSQRGVSHLVYSKYQYGNKTNTPLMEFKSRNGFDRLNFPRYYVPLTLQGRIAVGCRLHRGALGLLPSGVITNALRMRESLNGLLTFDRRSSGAAHKPAVVDE